MTNYRVVIDKTCLPARLPLAHSVLWPLALDYWGAPTWVWASAMTALALLWAWSLHRAVFERPACIAGYGLRSRLLPRHGNEFEETIVMPQRGEAASGVST